MEITTEVSQYSLKSMRGGHICKATQVKFSDGVTVRFMERIGKKRAIDQAWKRRIGNPERYGA